MARNDTPNDAGRGPDKVGVYPSAGPAAGAAAPGTAAGTTAAGTTAGVGATLGSTSGATHTAAAGSTGDAADRSYAGTRSSPTRWIVPALIVALIILALLWWL
jgi:hypothetical protein